jgi:hypothetical protein
VGNNPFVEIEKVTMDDDLKLLDFMIQALTEMYDVETSPYFDEFAQRYNASLLFIEIAAKKLEELGYVRINELNGRDYFSLTHKGKQYADKKGFIQKPY